MNILYLGLTRPHPRNRIVRLYIHPQDKSRPLAYWLQSPVTEPGGAWSFKARFGNPFWHDMSGRSPITYDIFVVLFKRLEDIPANDSEPVLLDEGSDFNNWLKQHGATAVANCSVKRFEEKGCSFLPRIMSPAPLDDPRNRPKVGRQVTLIWEPNRKMWMELWRSGHGVDQYPCGWYDNHLSVSLDTGIYELKIKETQESQCEASVWFEVVNSM